MQITIVCFSVLAVMIPVTIVMLIDNFQNTNTFADLIAHIAYVLDDEDKRKKLMKRLPIICGILLLASFAMHQLTNLIK